MLHLDVMKPRLRAMQQSNSKIFYLAIGWIFTGLGFIGAFLPVMPTTPFLLVAVWAFGKSSRSLKKWLYEHPKFGPYISDWFDHGVVSQKAKFLSVSMMGVGLGFTVFSSGNIYVILGVGLTMVATATFILTRPSARAVVIKTQS